MIIEGPDGKTRNTHRGLDADREVTFHNVTITVADARNPADAYDRVCTALASIESDGVLVEWQTDTYTTDDDVHHPTKELFPPSGSKRESKD